MVSKIFSLGAGLVLLSMVGGCQQAPENSDIALAEGLPIATLVAQLSQEEKSVGFQDETQSVSVPEGVAAFCGDCHQLPDPQDFERHLWYSKVRKGYEFYVRSRRSDLDVPEFAEVYRYYLDNAPESIQFPSPEEVDRAWAGRFTQTKLDWRDGEYILPSIAQLAWLPLMDGKSYLVASDMRDGSVSLIEPSRDSRLTRRSLLTRLASPARFASGDLDQDGYQDLVVAELGSSYPFDHQYGKVVWLQYVPEEKRFQKHELQKNLGRVADVATLDADGDKDLDLVVAEFGHRQKGSLKILVNELDEERAGFASQTIQDLPGTVRLAVADWDQDQELEFSALLSQEYETVQLFDSSEANSGALFRLKGIYQGQDLTWGSVDLVACDLDSDGDTDFVYAHGDSFDNNHAQLHHGIDWLENKGEGQFEQRQISKIPGVYQVRACDIDNDGDLDLLAVANLPTFVEPRSLIESNPVSILLLEQGELGEFLPHVLERGTPRYPTLECGDFDRDGKLDFAVGAQLIGTDPAGSAAASLSRITVWWNNGD
ncbi:MAG: VCBS repeat-containing protein [Planctomycetota bacterium]